MYVDREKLTILYILKNNWIILKKISNNYIRKYNIFCLQILCYLFSKENILVRALIESGSWQYISAQDVIN